MSFANRADAPASAVDDRRSRLVAQLDRVQFALLGALLFVLPLLEGPKNILLVLLLAVGVAGWVLRGTPLSRPSALEAAMLLLLAASAISTAVNWPFENGVKGLKDLFFQLVVAVVAYRVAYDVRRARVLGACAVAGTVIAVIVGMVRVGMGKRVLLELHSVGVATHSALYIGIVTLVAIGLLLDRREADPRFRWVWIGAIFILLVGLAGTGSRGAMLAFGAVLIVQLVATRHWRMMSTLAVMAIVAAAAVFSAPDVFQQRRLLEKVENTLRGGPTGESDRIRIVMWRIAIEQVKQGGHWLAGIGPRNYASIDFNKLKFDPPLGMDPSGMLRHAHNLFLTKLVEEGVLGLAALIALFVVVAAALLRGLRAAARDDWIWTAALGALLISIVAGSFNTPFYQEHAVLSMALFGLLLSRDWVRPRRA